MLSLKLKRYILDNNDIVNSTLIKTNLHSADLLGVIIKCVIITGLTIALQRIIYTKQTKNKCFIADCSCLKFNKFVVFQKSPQVKILNVGLFFGRVFHAHHYALLQSGLM